MRCLRERRLDDPERLVGWCDFHPGCIGSSTSCARRCDGHARLARLRTSFVDARASAISLPGQRVRYNAANSLLGGRPPQHESDAVEILQQDDDEVGSAQKGGETTRTQGDGEAMGVALMKWRVKIFMDEQRGMPWYITAWGRRHEGMRQASERFIDCT